MAQEPEKAKPKGKFSLFGKKAPEAAAPPPPPATPSAAATQSAGPAMPDQAISQTNAPAGTPNLNAPKLNGDADKNVFTELFGEDDAASKSGMMDTVMKQESKKGKSFFSKKPKLKSVKAKPKKKTKARPGRAILQVSMLLIVLVMALGYTQNSLNFQVFGVNVAQRSTLAQTQVDDLNGDIIVQKALTAVLLLEQFSTLADEYLYNISQTKSDFVSSNKRASLLDDNEELLPEMVVILEEIQDLIKKEPTSSEKQFAIANLQDQVAALKAKTGEVNEISLLQDIQDLDTARALLQSNDFKSAVTSLNLEEITDRDIDAIWMRFNNDINQSITAIISSIREDRMPWSLIFNEFEDTTKKTDPLFNTEFESNLNINDAKFTKNPAKATISGIALTDDTKTFTLVSNLIDALDESDYFAETDDRVYNKTEAEGEYTYNFRVGMDITKDNNEG